jgi:hypothetical protein
MRFMPDGDIKYQLNLMLNEGLVFGDNIRGGFLEFETTGDVQEIRHGLNTVPPGFILISLNDDSSGEGPFSLWSVNMKNWTKELIYVRANSAGLTARIFVLG